MKKAIASNKYVDLITWLKEAREKQNLTMRDVAELINKPHQFINKIESGERKLDVYEFVQYCKALELDPVDGINLLK